MKKASSSLAQGAFDAVLYLHRLSVQRNLAVGLLARVVNKFAKPVARKLGAKHTVVASAYGHTLAMPAEHLLPSNLARFPRYNRPLSMALEAIAAQSPSTALLTVIDVGANIGDTVAILEERLPGRCAYLCIEPDATLAALCKSNHEDNARIEIAQCFIGEKEGASVRLENDGRANPATKIASGPQTGDAEASGQLLRLDTVARRFAETHGLLSLIKVDTEGYDFSVMRSGSDLLMKYQPCLFFEWFPRLLRELDEAEWQGFEDLAAFGYHHFVFFTELGDFYCKVSHPDRVSLRGLAAVVLGSTKVSYFDVFASTSEAVCNQVVELSIEQDLSRVSKAR